MHRPGPNNSGEVDGPPWRAIAAHRPPGRAATYRFRYPKQTYLGGRGFEDSEVVNESHAETAETIRNCFSLPVFSAPSAPLRELIVFSSQPVRGHREKNDITVLLVLCGVGVLCG